MQCDEEMQHTPHDETEAVRAMMVSLGALLEEHRGAIRRPVRIGIAVVDAGHYLIDTGSKTLVYEGWSDELDFAVVCSPTALEAALTGTLDPEAPAEGQVWIWAGDASAWGALAEPLEGVRSMLDLRVSRAREGA